MTVRVSWPGKALGVSSQAVALRALLGDGAYSVYPRLDDPRQVPGSDLPTPWIWWKREPEIQTLEGTRILPVTWWVYDDPGQQYHRIDAVEAALIDLYLEDGGAATWYEDPAGSVWWQRYAGAGEDAEDDQWHYHLRVCRWELRRD